MAFNNLAIQRASLLFNIKIPTGCQIWLAIRVSGFSRLNDKVGHARTLLMVYILDRYEFVEWLDANSMTFYDLCPNICCLQVILCSLLLQ